MLKNISNLLGAKAFTIRSPKQAVWAWLLPDVLETLIFYSTCLTHGSLYVLWNEDIQANVLRKNKIYFRVEPGENDMTHVAQFRNKCVAMRITQKKGMHVYAYKYTHLSYTHTFSHVGSCLALFKQVPSASRPAGTEVVRWCIRFTYETQALSMHLNELTLTKSGTHLLPLEYK